MVPALEKISSDLAVRNNRLSSPAEPQAFSNPGASNAAEQFAKAMERARATTPGQTGSHGLTSDAISHGIEAGGKALSEGYFNQFNSVLKLTEMSPADPAYFTQAVATMYQHTKTSTVRHMSLTILSKSVSAFNQLLKTQ